MLKKHANLLEAKSRKERKGEDLSVNSKYFVSLKVWGRSKKVEKYVKLFNLGRDEVEDFHERFFLNFANWLDVHSHILIIHHWASSIISDLAWTILLPFSDLLSQSDPSKPTNIFQSTDIGNYCDLLSSWTLYMSQLISGTHRTHSTDSF